ncbi:MAG: HD domain-containing phosphohydrolase [Candidatus Omnitrophota bacterium]
MKVILEHKKAIEKIKKSVGSQNEKLNYIFNICRQSVVVLASDKAGKLNILLKAIIDQTTEVLNSEIGSILLLTPGKNEISIYVAKGLSKEIVQKTKLKVGEKISGWVVEHKKSLLVEDIEKDDRFTKGNNERYYTKSLISAPILVDDNVVGVININNKHDRTPFNREDLKLLEILAMHAGLLINNVNQYEKLQRLYMNTIKALAQAIDARDHYTKKHSECVTKYAVNIAKEMKLSNSEIADIEKAGRLHDIGKIGIHDYILTKPGKLTKEEWDEVKGHSLKGAKILEPLAFLGNAVRIIREHHERYDGTGYPDKKKKDEICIGAKIMAVADSFDAMTTNRPYARALSEQEAINELKRESGKQFDTATVKAFLRILKKNKKE